MRRLARHVLGCGVVRPYRDSGPETASEPATPRAGRKGPQARRVRAAISAESQREILKLSQRQRLIEAMVELSAKSGYQEVSIAELCSGAGVSPVTFYEEFADKEEVLVGAYRTCAECVFGPMREALFTGETAEVPRLALGAMLEAIAGDPDAARIVFVEALGGGERMLAERTRAFGRFERRVEQLMERLPSTITVDIPVSAVAGALRHIVSRHLRTQAEDQLPSRLDDGLAWLYSYLRTGASEPWSTSPRALLELVSATQIPTQAEPPRPERLPRGRHGLPASLIARSQRTRIIQATAEVTMQKGYAAAKVNDIVAAARVAKPVFYQYFQDKQHAFLEAQQFPTQYILDRCAEAYFTVDEWPERVWRCFQTLIELIVSNPAISHLRLVECYAAGPVAIQRAEDITRSFTMFLHEGYRYREAAASLPRLASQAIAGAFFEIVQRQVAASQFATLAAHLPQLTYLALAPFTGADEAIGLVEELKAKSLCAREPAASRGGAPPQLDMTKAR
jgi:AcrR family transcriptional regulator